MTKSTEMGPYVMFDLKKAKFQMEAVGSLMIGTFALATANVSCEVSPSRFWYKTEISYLGGLMRMSVEMDIGIKYLKGVPYYWLKKYEYIIDFSRLFKAIKDNAKKAIEKKSKLLWKLVSAIKIFDAFAIGANSLTITDRPKITLAIDITVFFRLKVRLTLDLGPLIDIFAGKFGKIVEETIKSLVKAVVDFNPCECKPGGYAAGKSERMWGHYMKQYSGRYLIPCGASSQRHTGHWCGPQCGCWVRWGGGRRRWKSGPPRITGSGCNCCHYHYWTPVTNHCSFKAPAVGYHTDSRRRLCKTVSFCGILFRTWKFDESRTDHVRESY